MVVGSYFYYAELLAFAESIEYLCEKACDVDLEVYAGKLVNILRSDSELWFTDGIVIIIACSVAFKVHRGQLRRHSQVFDDLFSIPQSKDQDLYDGWPWVQVYNCPSDVIYFLPRSLRWPALGVVPTSPPSPPSCAASPPSTLVKHLRQRCIACLEVDWPSTLAAWDQREQAATDAFEHYQPRASCPYPLLIIDLILALGSDLAHLLHAAFYDPSHYSPSKILSGTPTPPLSLACPRPIRAHPCRVQTHAPRARAPPHNLLRARSRAGLPRCLHFHAPARVRAGPPLRVPRGRAARAAHVLFTLLQAVECKVDFRKCAGRAREEVRGLLPGRFGL
ncbi:hypothetical protein B0H14DRAFT_3525749 [Mycena olivaceomarginata]|nr:hypothetical protein B0H14DRAFT_3525749 [Mycena olivaceomarginata]